MKAITLTQPWATLVAVGAKQFETRSWATNYRGPIAIHAAKGLSSIGGPKGLFRIASEPLFCDVLAKEPLPLGQVIAIADLLEIVPTEVAWLALSEMEDAFGDFGSGRMAWSLRNVWRLPVGVPARGALGLWDWQPPLDVQAMCERAR